MAAPSDCQACPLYETRTNVVNGVAIGYNPQVMIVGEGPGVTEDKGGEPFLGPTGKALVTELTSRGIHSYYLTNATRCFPGHKKNEGALKKGVEACNPYLLEDIEREKPKVILALGVHAIRALGITDPISTVLAQVLEGPYGIPVVVSYHPAAFMYREHGSIHLFELAVHKVMQILYNVALPAPWEPQQVPASTVLKDVHRLSIDTETSSKDPLKAELVLATVTSDNGTWVVYPDNPLDMHILRVIWRSPLYEKCFQNADYDLIVLEKLLGRINNYAWDTMLAEHILHEQTHYSLEALRGVYTQQPVHERPLRLYKEEIIEEITGYTKKGKPKIKKYPREKIMDGYADVPPEILVSYAIGDTQLTHLVWGKQEALFTDEQRTLFREVTLPMQQALTQMERNGLVIDAQRLPEIRRFYLDRTEQLRKQIHTLADSEFLLSSPKQVKEILFEELGLPKPPIKSKITGDVSTGKKSLEWLKTHANHPIIEPIIEYREYDKLLSQFLGYSEDSDKGLFSNIVDGKIHATYRLTLETGRTSSSPNVQNLPKEEKGPIRELVIAQPGNYLLQVDYSQIELRIAAYLAKDQKLIQMLESGGDVHLYFARALFPEVEPELDDATWKKKYDHYRTLAKRFTFGRLFGQGEYGMAMTFNIAKEEAQRFQEVYAELFPKLAEWWAWIENQVALGVPLKTRWGRMRRFPIVQKMSHIYWKGKEGMIGHLQREALNFLPQGTAADVLNKAIGNIHRRIEDEGLPLTLRLPVHDSLTVECAESELQWASNLLVTEMEAIGDRFEWRLPCEPKYGRTWAGELGLVP